MGELIGAAMLLVVPFAAFIWVQWRREERNRARRRDEGHREGPTVRSKDHYWGGMGRPGR